jgi:hypothetical protein
LFRALPLDQPDLMERWRERAEYCFLFRLLPPAEQQFLSIRETPIRKRKASLVEMQLPTSKKLVDRTTT